MRRFFVIVVALTFVWGLWPRLGAMNCMAKMQLTGPLQTVSGVATRQQWNRFKILVWPYKTGVPRDFKLYRKLELGGFQIDRGAGQDRKVDFSVKQNLPYYVGHAADKGFLYLTGGNKKSVTGRRGLVTRPHSLADPSTVQKMKKHLLRNVTTTKK